VDIGVASDVQWIAGRPDALSATHERAVVDVLVRHTAEQAWWLGYLDTGAHDVVFPSARSVSLYSRWLYVLIEAGPSKHFGGARATLRGGVEGSLPDLFFLHDRSWLVSALWDDTWASLGGSHALIDALVREPVVNARAVHPQEDAPPGLTRDGGGQVPLADGHKRCSYCQARAWRGSLE